jgi:hypothetical protein
MRRSSQDQMVEYFKRNLKKSYTTDALKWALINQGYSRVIVEKALEQAQQEIAKEAPILKEKPTIRYQVLDDEDNPVSFKTPWWKRLFRI